MIARCEKCDQKRRATRASHFYGYRWEPSVAPLADWRCHRGGWFLRMKKPGEVEHVIVPAKRVIKTDLPPAA